MTQTIPYDGNYVEAVEVPSWPCVLGDLPQPLLTLKDDDLFLLTDTLGNIGGCALDGQVNSVGFFARDTRFLSRLELQVAGRPPILLSSSADKGFALSVLATNPGLENIPAETLGIKREMVLNGGLFETIEVTNYSTEPVALAVSLSFDADFADLFEVRGAKRPARGKFLRPVAQQRHWLEGEGPVPAEVVMAYLGVDGVLLEARLEFQKRTPDRYMGQTAIWDLEIISHQSITLSYRLCTYRSGQPVSNVPTPANLGQAKAAELLEEQEWQQQVTQIRSEKNTFNNLIDRAEQDIYLLRQSFDQGKALSAGVPWFSTLFGRDSLIAASQTLILNPQIAKETLEILAHYQGKTEDAWRDEQPGKILHEIRFGEMARCGEIPHTPYYGTVDATPLWLMLYAEYYAWTADRDLIDRLWTNALAAMNWIDRELKAGNGYLSYRRKSKNGLDNQGWKDSGNCIVNAKGEMAKGSIALSEVQGYVYAAKVRLAQLARQRGEEFLADRWEQEAKELKQRFNRDFWMADLDFCALALDGEGAAVDSITSNPGHCLGLGILTPDHAYSTAERLRAPDMFNGWGVRTLSSLCPAYNPMGYHIGSVWPHDNSLIAMGLRSLGLIDQALEIGQALIDMTRMQPYGRPPELFCGYERQEDSTPVQYPVACSPQAWATGSLFQLVQMMVNLVPDAPGNYLRIIDPALPPSISSLSLKNLRVGTTLLDLEFERSGRSTACRVSKKRGNLRVVIEA
ncbi:MAG: amylo-alpha-1,6-glucosidase [Alkalinema sp. RU_4_3]|nr:amylo-alpha-1,6-glucosidase [Alkalinema sp. RU_4_3]